MTVIHMVVQRRPRVEKGKRIRIDGAINDTLNRVVSTITTAGTVTIAVVAVVAVVAVGYNVESCTVPRLHNPVWWDQRRRHV
jgi:hypothetical protein